MRLAAAVALAILLTGPAARAEGLTAYRAQLISAARVLGPPGAAVSRASLLRARQLLPGGQGQRVDLTFLRRQLAEAATRQGHSRQALAGAARQELKAMELAARRSPPTAPPGAAARLHRILSDPRFRPVPVPAWLASLGGLVSRVAGQTVAGIGLGLLGGSFLLLLIALVLRSGTWREAAWHASPTPVATTLRPADLLAQAREAAGEGRFRLGVRLLHGALLAQLARQHRLELRPQATDADYLLEAGAAVPSLLQATQLFRRVWFGTAPCGPAQFETMERLVDHARRDGATDG